jgi:hypothetical protein
MQDILDREPKTEPNASHREGPVARTIEQQTAKLPSDTFLWAAAGSIGLSLALMLTGQEKKAHFVGQWAPTLNLRFIQQNGEAARLRRSK